MYFFVHFFPDCTARLPVLPLPGTKIIPAEYREPAALIGISKHMEKQQKDPYSSRLARRREQNRLNVARYRARHGDAHRTKWAAYMRAYRAQRKLLQTKKEENEHEHRTSRRRSRQRQDHGNH